MSGENVTFMYGEPINLSVLDAKKLADRGYRRTSTKHRMVSRIDREDWLEVLARHLHRSVAELYIQGTNTISPNWTDYYRRVLSKDTLMNIDPEVHRAIPGSSGDGCGYVPPFTTAPPPEPKPLIVRGELSFTKLMEPPVLQSLREHVIVHFWGKRVPRELGTLADEMVAVVEKMCKPSVTATVRGRRCATDDEHNWQKTDNWLIDRCSICGEERA